MPNGALDRHPNQLEAIAWHLLIADEALRYANPATHAHQALKRVRLGSAADCWLLTPPREARPPSTSTSSSASRWATRR